MLWSIWSQFAPVWADMLMCNPWSVYLPHRVLRLEVHPSGLLPLIWWMPSWEVASWVFLMLWPIRALSDSGTRTWMFLIQYKFNCVDNFCGIMLITTENCFDAPLSFFKAKIVVPVRYLHTLHINRAMQKNSTDIFTQWYKWRTSM